ncbi:Nn.00g095630.m01.CDS01 [Neocucurbitaria sp. VM-36]
MAPPPNSPAPYQQPSTFFNTVLNNPSAAQPSALPPPRSRQPEHSSTTTTFTPTQRSLQARNKIYNVSPGSKGVESYEQRQRRDEAACILESTEMLIWYAAARNESIPQTRHYYQNIVLGVTDNEDAAWREEWEVSTEEREREFVPSPARSGKGKEKVKKRVSIGRGQ